MRHELCSSGCSPVALLAPTFSDSPLPMTDPTKSFSTLLNYLNPPLQENENAYNEGSDIPQAVLQSIMEVVDNMLATESRLDNMLATESRPEDFPLDLPEVPEKRRRHEDDEDDARPVKMTKRDLQTYFIRKQKNEEEEETMTVLLATVHLLTTLIEVVDQEEQSYEVSDNFLLFKSLPSTLAHLISLCRQISFVGKPSSWKPKFKII